MAALGSQVRQSGHTSGYKLHSYGDHSAAVSLGPSCCANACSCMSVTNACAAAWGSYLKAYVSLFRCLCRPARALVVLAAPRMSWL